ncbi:hypothetical protein ACA910_015498 [Epithemia clementina (nom. ined.)]
MAGRPSLTFSRTRAAAAKAVEEEESSLCTAMSYRRRFPKLGSQFQAKVPKKTSTTIKYETERPIPIRMSSDLPHMTEEEASVYTNSNSASELQGRLMQEVTPCPSPLSKSVVAVVPSSTGSRNLYESEPHPSGVVFSNPEENAFATTTIRRSTITTTDDNNQHEQENLHKKWMSVLVGWHEAHEKAQAAAASARNRKSRFKRPRDVPSVPDLCPPPSPKVRALIDNHHNDSNPTQQHIPAEQAKWSLVVDIEAGQACKRLREMKRKKIGNMVVPNEADWIGATSKRWRMLRQRPCVAVRGDYRTTRVPSLLGTHDKQKHFNVFALQTKWKAILACSNAYQQRLSAGPPMGLSTLVALLENSNKLVPPEHVWPAGDPIIDEINTKLDGFVEPVENAKKIRAQWMDLWYKDGVELDVLRKSLKQVEPLMVRPDEYDEVNRQLEQVAEWQSRVDALKNSPRSAQNNLNELEAFFNEARDTHGFQSKGVLELKCKLEKAHELRDRILDWKKTITERQEANVTDPPLENMKFLAALVREISRLKLKFPAACSVLELSEVVEAWVERANIAIRSRISLTEIKSLIRRGLDIPIELTEHLDKLKARESKAQEWLDRLSEYVAVSDPEGMAPLEWMRVVRSKICEGGNAVNLIHELACEGNRIPVEMDCVKLLQIELDARNWSVKARSWIPDGPDDDGCKKGKLEDIREHLEKATCLRNRLVLTPEEKDEWVLDAEPELKDVISQVDQWFEQYRDFVESDSRRGCRPEIPISVLRESVEKANAIYVNLGPASLKVAKILSQAEKWYSKHGILYERCRAEGSDCEKVLLESVKEAVADAESGIGGLDLKEAIELQQLMERIESWVERASVAIGGKKLRGKQKLVFEIDDVNELIQEGNRLPVNFSVEIQQLEDSVKAMIDWKTRATNDIQGIASGFQQLKEAVDGKYGQPDQYTPTYGVSGGRGAVESKELLEEKKQEAEEPPSDNESTMDVETPECLRLSEATETLIRDISQDVKTSCLVSDEGKVVLQLEDVSRWTGRSLKYVGNPREIFDSRFFGAFDRFLTEGKGLLDATVVEAEGVMRDASLSWRTVMDDQMKRLNVLLRERGEFVSWCGRAEESLSGSDKKLTIEKLRELLHQSNRFPADGDVVLRVQGLAQKCEAWISMSSTALNSEDKLPLHEAKVMLEEGNRLGIVCNELRTLRSGVKVARGWANKVKKCKPDQIQTQIKLVKSLLDEYDNLIVSLPEEYKRLSFGLKNYCICRRPYEGFMIKCEKCEDWFHGPCVGVSPSRAEKKVDKYVCVRCLVAKVFQTSTTCIASILRKWTSDADLKKARMADAQKHQRKIRKETKDLEKLHAEAEQINQILSQPKSQAAVCVEEGAAEGTPMAHAFAVTETSSMTGGVPSTETSPPEAATVSIESTPQRLEPEIDAQPESEENMGLRIGRVTAAIKLCESKLQDLAHAAVRQRNEEEIENVKADVMKKWCIRVRSLVFAPTTEEQALNSRPLVNGGLSRPMATLLQEAAKHGLTRYTDVQSVLNAFKCLCWSSQTMHILARRPRACDAVASVRNASSLKLPDEKGLRVIKSMAQRATAWNFKASRLLTPVPGETRPYDMKELRNLADIADDIPLRMPFEPRVQAVIEDRGSRHCVCGGPSDGRLMLSCDKCENWFHGYCVGIKPEDSEEIDEWVCPPCRGDPVDVSQDFLRGFHDAFGREEEEDQLDSDEEDSSSKAPRIEKLWPPFGLLGSSECITSLGEHLCSLPDDMGLWDSSSTTQQLSSAGLGGRAAPLNQLCIAKPSPNDRQVKLPAEISAPNSVQVGNRSKPLPDSTGTKIRQTAAQDTSMSAIESSESKGNISETFHSPVHVPSATVQHSFGRQAECMAERLPESRDNGLSCRAPSVMGRQNGQIALSNRSQDPDEDGLLDPVARLLAIKDVLVAPVKDN